jgi:predicted ATPase
MRSRGRSACARRSQCGAAPPLADLVYEPFAAGEIARLEQLRLAASEDLIDAELELGHNSDLVPELDALIAEYPFDERLRAQLMLALYRGGRQSEALEAYQAARRLLDEELGLEPGPPLRELEQAILRHDPALGSLQLAPPAGSRRTVTVLVAAPGNASGDPETAGDAVAEVRAAIERHQGTSSFAGDSVLGVFGVPHLHEDDALRALRAADELSGLRIGVATGESYVQGDVVAGAPIAEARRLEQAARPGETLVAPASVRLVRHAVRARQVTRAGVAAFRLDELLRHGPAIPGPFTAPLIGREEELAALRRAFATARDERRCVLVNVIGDAGIGKSRLAHELLREVPAEATVLIGRCVSYGEGATFLPLTEMIGREAVPAGSRGEIFLSARRRLEELASERPLVLLFEDVHWAAPTLLDFVEYLVDEVEALPVLVLCLARPDVLAQRPGWSASLVLEPLSDEQARELAGDDNADRIVEIAEGNPLYVQQLAAYVAEEGVGALESVPGSIEALLASRVDRLGADELALAQRAAVVGRRFSPSAIAALGPTDALGRLVHDRFVHRSGDVYRFHHVLIRDVVYAGTAKVERAELHERHARWLDDRSDGTDALVGYHLARAAGFLAELGKDDRGLAAEAGSRLAAAGIHAWKRGDAATTINLLEHATRLLPEQDRLALDLRCELGEALQTAGELARADAVLADTVERARAAGHVCAGLRAGLSLLNIRLWTTTSSTADDLMAAIDEAIPVLAQHGDERALGRAWYYASGVHGAYHCRYAECAAAVRQALVHYRNAGWPVAACLNGLAGALKSGPTPVPEAISDCAQLLEGADVNARANVLANLAALHAMQGEFDLARNAAAEARSSFAATGQRAAAEYVCGEIEAEIETLAGDDTRARALLETNLTALEAFGSRAYVATRRAMLAQVLCRLGDVDEAERLALAALDESPQDDLHTQWRGHVALANAFALRGLHDEAQAQAREAVDVLEGTDALSRKAECRLALAEVLSTAGDDAAARPAIREALALYSRKGHSIGVRRARVLLGES